MNALEVDCTRFIVAALYGGVVEPETGRTARIVTELPNKLTDVLPVIQVFRIGGPNDGVVLDSPTITLHGFAATQQQANRLLHVAYTTLRLALGRVITVDGGDAVLARVRVLGGPSWAPYENTALRHAVSTVQARIKITA